MCVIVFFLAKNGTVVCCLLLRGRFMANEKKSCHTQLRMGTCKSKAAPLTPVRPPTPPKRQMPERPNTPPAMSLQEKQEWMPERQMPERPDTPPAMSLREKLEKEWRYQQISEEHFPAMHLHVHACMLETQALATQFGACVQLCMFNETIGDARPSGPFYISWEPDMNQEEVERVRASLGPAADGPFSSAEELESFGVSVLSNHSVAVPCGSWGLSTFYTTVGFLVPATRHVRR